MLIDTPSLDSVFFFRDLPESSIGCQRYRLSPQSLDLLQSLRKQARLSSRRHAQHGHRATLARLQEVADGTEPLQLVLSQRRLSKFLNLPPNRTYSRPGALPAMRGDAQHSDNVFCLIL